MDESKQIPTSLKIVAVLFIIGGICSVIEVIVAVFNGRININLGVLGLFVGPGLLKFKVGWRTCALVFIWIALIGIPLAAVIMLGVSGPLDFNLFGQKVGHVSKVYVMCFAVPVFLLYFWMYRVLTRSDVRRLFGLESEQ